MLERIVELSIRQRFAVLAAVFIFAAVGIYSFGRLKIDAVPDITNVQVQINTSAPGFSPLEAEQRITYPVETAIAGLPGLSYTRSVSRYGLSQVTVVFEDGTDMKVGVCEVVVWGAHACRGGCAAAVSSAAVRAGQRRVQRGSHERTPMNSPRPPQGPPGSWT